MAVQPNGSFKLERRIKFNYNPNNFPICEAWEFVIMNVNQ